MRQALLTGRERLTAVTALLHRIRLQVPRGGVSFWPDPVIGVGLVEPVRVEDEHSDLPLVTKSRERWCNIVTKRVARGLPVEGAR